MKDLSDLCNSYRTRADAFAELLRKLRELCGDSRGGLPGLPPKSEELADHLIEVLRFRRAECNPTYRVALAGGYSVGKSELINAFLNSDLLPQEMQDLTFIPTILKASESGTFVAKVRHLTHSEVTEILTYYSRRIGPGIFPAEISEVETMSARKLDAAKAQLENDRERDDLETLCRALRDPDLRRYVFESEQAHEREIDRSEIAGFVKRRSSLLERYIAGAVTIELPDFPFAPGVELVDLPGTDADDPWAKQLTTRFVKEVDALLLVSEADQVFGDASAELLQQIRNWGGDHAQRLIVVLNKTDVYAGKSGAEIRGAYQMLREGMSRYFPAGQPLVFFVCAHAALQVSPNHEQAGQAVQRIEKTDDPLLDQALSHTREEGGVPHLRRRLAEFLQNRAAEVKRGSLEKKWAELVRPFFELLVPAADIARDELADSKSRVLARSQKRLDSIMKSLQDAAAEFRTMADSYDSKPLTGNEALMHQLDGLPKEVVNTPPEGAMQFLNAYEGTRQRWKQLSDWFRQSLVSSVQEHLVESFVHQVEEGVSTNLEGLAELRRAAGGDEEPTLARIPPHAIRESLQLRVEEILYRRRRARPFNVENLDDSFEDLKESFHKQASDFFRSQVREVLAELQTCLGFHVSWHVDRAVGEAEAFAESLSEGGRLAQIVERCPSWIDEPEEAREKERLALLVELGDEMRRIADSASIVSQQLA